MHSLLKHILNSNPHITSDKILLICNISNEEVESLREIEGFENMKFIYGDHFTEATLLRARPEKAKKIFILADQSPMQNGIMPTASEADSRTIMTAMTLSHIAKGASIIAEIIDPKMDQYLKLAHVQEIVYSRDYSRLMIANAASGIGLSNIYHELLDPKSIFYLNSIKIPNDLVGKTYQDAREYYFQESQGI